MEDVRIGFFRIDKCGYYRHGERLPQFCHLDQMLAQLHGWSQDKMLARTQTYQSSPELLRAFLYDIQENDGDWLLTLWNETAANQGVVPSVRPNDAVGEARVHFNGIAEGSVPGFASYFWFAPQENIFANLRFHQILGGHAQLRKYLTGYLQRSTSHVVMVEDPRAQDVFDLEVKGYCRAEGDEPEHLNALFKSSAYVKPGRIDMLQARVHDITRVHRRVTLDLAVQDDVDFWQKLQRRLTWQPHNVPEDQVLVAYEMKTPVSQQELAAMIQMAHGDPDNTWDDIGFDLRGGASTQWLGKSYARDVIRLDVERRDQEIVDGQALLTQLRRQRGNLMRILAD